MPLPPAEAERFTYLAPENVWVEKLPRPQTAEEADLPCWVGPLKLRTQDIQAAIEDWIRRTPAGAEPGREVPIGPLLNQQGPATLVRVSSVDVGVPAAWNMAATAKE